MAKQLERSAPALCPGGMQASSRKLLEENQSLLADMQRLEAAAAASAREQRTTAEAEAEARSPPSSLPLCRTVPPDAALIPPGARAPSFSVPPLLVLAAAQVESTINNLLEMLAAERTQRAELEASLASSGAAAEAERRLRFADAAKVRFPLHR